MSTSTPNDDQGHPESEEDLENIRMRNNQRRKEMPDLPSSVGESDRGVMSGEERGESTKAPGAGS